VVDSWIHDKAFEMLVRNNLPEPEVNRDKKVWLREISLGFKKLGINMEDVKKFAKDFPYSLAMFMEREILNSNPDQIQMLREHGFVEKTLYENFLKKDLVFRKKDLREPFYVDLLVLFKDMPRVWIIELKEKLNFRAIGQVLVYRDLLEEDYPEFKEIFMGVACFETDDRIELTCKKLGIKVFILEKDREYLDWVKEREEKRSKAAAEKREKKRKEFEALLRERGITVPKIGKQKDENMEVGGI